MVNSHTSKDKPFVDRLVSDLAAHGIPVWYDKLDLRLGDSIPGKINSGLSGAQYSLIVLSPAAVKSSWVREELNAALMRQVASAGTFLLPVLVEDCDVPPLLAHRRFADFRTDYRAGLAELLELFGRALGRPKGRAKSLSIRGPIWRFPTGNLSTCTQPDSTNSFA
jgi:TIR domain